LSRTKEKNDYFIIREKNIHQAKFKGS